jgi:hypothetical protein
LARINWREKNGAIKTCQISNFDTKKWRREKWAEKMAPKKWRENFTWVEETSAPDAPRNDAAVDSVASHRAAGISLKTNGKNVDGIIFGGQSLKRDFDIHKSVSNSMTEQKICLGASLSA